MAVQRVGIQFDFNANTKQAETNLNALEKTMARLETRMQKMGAQAAATQAGGVGRANTERLLEQYGDTRIDLRSPIRQTEILTDNIRKGKIGWEEYGRAVKQNSAIVTQQLAMQTGAIHSVRKAGEGFTAVFSPNATLSGISGIEIATAKMRALSESTKAYSQHIIDAGKNTAFTARQMTISLSMPMAIMGGMAIKQFTDIDKHLTDISKVYDDTADGVEMSVGRIRASMKELARELSRTQGAEISDTLDIAQYYAQMGKTGEELRESTVQASRLMVLGDVDIDDAQKTITTLTAVVGANVEELGKYVDYLNKVEDSTQLTMQDFAKTLPTIAPLVKTFIPDDKDQQMAVSATMMETARRAGFDPKESANAWKSMYGSFVRPAARTEAVFSTLTGKYGQQQNLRDVVQRFEGDPVQILQELADITREWSLTDRGQLMTQLTGKWQLSRGLGFMNAMDASNPANAAALERMSGINEELVRNPEALADNSKRQMDLIRNSAHTRLQQFKQDVQFMFADLGERIFIPVMDALGNVLDVAKSAYNAMANIPEPLKDLVSIGAQLTFIAGPILAAMAATKMLVGYGGQMVASFGKAAASATRIGASMLGVNMQTTGKLEGKQETIARLQDKDENMIEHQMKEAIAAENQARARTVAVVEEKNAKTRESIQLQRELNRAVSGTVTPDGTAGKDPEKALRQYQASLKSAEKSWPMAIQAKDIGPESFRRHAGGIGAPASRVAGLGLKDNKVFADRPTKTAPVRVYHATNATRRFGDELSKTINAELDKVNAGIAVRRARAEETERQINRLRAERPAPRQSGTRGAEAINRKRAQIDERIAKLQEDVLQKNARGQVAGMIAPGLEDLERERASLLKAANGSQIHQAKVMSEVTAAKKLEADVTKKHAAAVAEETKRRSMRARIGEGFAAAPTAARNLVSNTTWAAAGDLDPLTAQLSRGIENIRSLPGDIKASLKDNFGRGASISAAAQERAWSQNTVRGGFGEYFRGHMTPRDIYTAQRSDAFKQIRKALEGKDETADIADIINDNELMRRDYFKELKKTYEAQGYDDITSHRAAQRDLEQSNLPTENALRREADMYMQRMEERAENVAKRQEVIAENAGRWASNLSNGAAAFGLLGTMGTQMLGIQNSLVDGALMLSNTVGAVGMLMPSLMEKAVGSISNFGVNMLDKFDATSLGTKLGTRLGDTMGTTTASRLSKALSSAGSMIMSATPYLVAAAAGFAALKGAWDIHRKDSEAYVQSLKEANDSVALHAELLGYVRKESESLDDLSYKEATDIRAQKYREDQSGRSDFVRQLANINASPMTGTIEDMTAVLREEAIRIIDDGGDDADVRSMVDAALKAAGVNDPVVVDNVKVHFKDMQITAEDAWAGYIEDEVRDKFAGEGTARSFGDKIVNELSGLNPFSADSRFNFMRDYDRFSGYSAQDQVDIEEAYRRQTETSKEFVQQQLDSFRGYINSASTEEEKAAIAEKFLDIMHGGIEQANQSGDVERIGAALRQFDDVIEGALKSSDSSMAGQLLTDQLSNLKDSATVLQAVLGGSSQESFSTPEKAATQYAKALGELQKKHGDVSIEEKKAVYNAIAVAGGMRTLGRDVVNATELLGKFEKVTSEAGEAMAGMTAQQAIDFLVAPDPAEMERNALRVESLSDALARSPESFHKRYEMEVDISEQESVQQFVDTMMRGPMEAGAQYAIDDAARMFKDRQDAAFDQIKAETDGAMKSLDAKQKASQKAFEARTKAMDAQFKAETKALDKQHNEEKKAFDKQQRERDKEFNKRQKLDQRAYDKQEKAQRKEFDKQQKAERESFNDSWDDRAESINNYYDNAIKAVENQGKAEEKLEKMRARNAERERKRLAYLAEMANSNIDLNIAVAGGNLDEAARIANNAVTSTVGYYQDQIDTEAGYAQQDRQESRSNRVDALNTSRGYAMDEFGRIRDDATEGFNEMQESASEKKDEELQAARDLYEEKKALEQEQYEEQKALEAERFAERQALEAERLQEQQERQREALEAERAAIQERHDAEREMIQETARIKEDGARRHFEATQRALDMEIQELMSRLPTSHAAIEDWVKEIEGTYARHGVYLDEEWGPTVQTNMMEAVANAMDIAANKIEQDIKWRGIGDAIGLEMREGTLRGYTGAQVAASIIFGTPIGDPANPPVTPGGRGNSTRMTPLIPENAWGPTTSQRHRDTSWGEMMGGVPRRATGGPISGPGTGTSDSILARLSNGEHVLTAKEVKALGGHSAVERLRKDILAGKVPGFATGGGVGSSVTPSATGAELNVRVASTGSGTLADGGVLSAVATDVSKMGDTFDATLTNTVAPAWQMFGDTMVKVKKDSIDPVLEGSQIALQEYANNTNQIMSANMNPTWMQFGQNLRMVKESLFDVALEDMKAGMQSLSSSISTAIANEIMPKWTEGSNHVKTMQDSVIGPTMQATRDATTQTAQNFGAAADMIGVGWGRVKENSAEPVRYTVGTVYNDGLVGMWNKVADALDLEPMTPHEVRFAEGGVMPGYTPGRDVHEFTSPTGGKLHLSGGEAIMRPEWTRAVGGPSAVAQMNADAKKGKVQRFADGGVVDAPGGGRPKGKPKEKEDTKEPATPYGMPQGTNISYGAPGFPAWVYSIGSKFGLRASTYPGHQEDDRREPGFAPNPQRQNRGIDWVGAIENMHTFAQYLVANGPSMPQLEQVIWMHPGTGQKIGWYGNAPAMGNSGIYANDWGGHANHVHTRQSQSLDGSGSMDGVILGLGGMGVTVDPKIIAAVSKFNEEKNALKDKIKAHIDAGPDTVMKTIPGKIFTAFTQGMDKKIQMAMPLMSGATIGAYGLNHEDYVKEIIAAAHERGLPMEAARIAIATALVESELRMYANHRVPESLKYPHEAIGSDHDSVGLFQQRDNGAWGTVAERMNARASAHLFYNRLQQFDWQSMAPGDAAQKVQVSAFPEKYATRMAEADALIRMVGGFEANANGVAGDDDKDKKPKEFGGGGTGGYFDQGGIASGMGVMQKAVISPERVLSPRQTQAFENLVPAINRVAEGGLSEADFMAKTNFDRDAAFKKMVERNSQAQIDFTGALEKITPVITQLTGHLKSMVVPGITGYANDLIKLDNDAQRIDKIATDVVNAVTNMQIPEINTDMQFNVGGNIYGDAQLNAILEQWRQNIIREVQAQQLLAQQAIGGK